MRMDCGRAALAGLVVWMMSSLAGAQPAANATVVPVAEPTLAPEIRLPLKNVDTVACACGCGIFDVGASGGMDFISSMPKSDSGFTVWLRYATMDQNQNWGGNHRISASYNDDKDLSSSFYTAGVQYNINRDWSVMGELPLFNRSLKTTDDDGSVYGTAGAIYRGYTTSLGDLKAMAVFHGFGSDPSNGVVFGFKLPTGNFSGPTGTAGGPLFDRDSLPGTGSTDVIVGGYHYGAITDDHRLGYFLQANYEVAVLTQDGYRPGNELDTAAGLTYSFGDPSHVRFVPVLQLLGSFRNHDSGINADPLNSGYSRVLIAPGLEVRIHQFHIYGDVEIPIYQSLNAAPLPLYPSGQLAAPVLFKLQTAYDF